MLHPDSAIGLFAVVGCAAGRSLGRERERERDGQDPALSENRPGQAHFISRKFLQIRPIRYLRQLISWLSATCRILSRMEKKKVLLVESTSDSPRPRRNEVLESRRGRADGALHVLVTSPARHLHLNPQKSNGVVKLPRKQSPLHGREASANEEAFPVPPLPLSIYPFTRSPVSPFFLFRHQSNSFSSLVVLNFALAGRKVKMSSLDATRAELGLVVLYLNKAEARDKICRAIQYGSKFISNGQPGTAQNVDRSTTLARKVFRLLKWVNDLHALISPPAKGTPLTLVLLGKSKNALLSTFLFLDQFVWAGRTGIIKNKEATDRVARLSLYCWMASSACAGLVELGELKRLSKSMRKLARELRDVDKYENEQYRSKMKQSDERLLALVKAAMDVVVAIGLLQLAPKKVTLRVTGAFGFITSLISCYQQLPSRAPAAKLKA